jgi:hypothetical protein
MAASTEKQALIRLFFQGWTELKNIQALCANG